MVRVAEGIDLNAEEQAIVDAFGSDDNARVSELVARASATRPMSRVREAYWELVSAGKLVPDAAGSVRLKL